MIPNQHIRLAKPEIFVHRSISNDEKKSVALRLIVIEGHQDRQGNITAEMQAAHNPPMNGVPVCDQVCVGNFEQILEHANNA